VVLTGEPPDVTRIPSGCRFHPRCPALLQDGRAEAAAITEACRSKPLPVIGTTEGHVAACWLPESQGSR
jgi:ABC-type dipeptide/oligopeptide/nickel transport system ATPase component